MKPTGNAGWIDCIPHLVRLAQTAGWVYATRQHNYRSYLRDQVPIDQTWSPDSNTIAFLWDAAGTRPANRPRKSAPVALTNLTCT
jgi:hypothetical protein